MAAELPFRPRMQLALAAAMLGLAALPGQAQVAVTNQGYVPFSDAPIFYRTRPPADPVALLKARLEDGQIRLKRHPRFGYLPALLKALAIPVSSQNLVFSQTSLQFSKINPQHPRALYYSEDVYVGQVHGGKVEIIAFDPMQGAIFYLLEGADSDRPHLERAELDCTQCHIAPATRGVPGVLLQSVFPTTSGARAPRTPQIITDQKSPLKERWGGWYVTGALAAQTMANAVVNRGTPAAAASRDADGRPLLSQPELTPVAAGFASTDYLAPTSDAVALLVLAHQTQMHNLITLTNYQTRLALHDAGLASDAAPALASLPADAQAQIRRPAEQLLRYMLFVGETPLGGLDGRRIAGQSRFARDFRKAAIRDSVGRSLRDFDLSNRMFRYPCSYLIYSSAFDAIPEPARSLIYERLLAILTGADQHPDFAGLSPQDRSAILSILRDTKPGLPAAWRQQNAVKRMPRLAAARLIRQPA
jgi:hypothetical protein